MRPAEGKRGNQWGRESRMMRSFRALDASYDKRIVGGELEVRLARGVLRVAVVNQE